jgi:hypothetical protein
LRLLDRDERIAEISRESRRPPGFVRVEAGEREGAAGVPQLVGVVTTRLELESGSQRVAADGDVEVLVHLDQARAARPGELRAAAVERVQHEDCGLGAERREADVVAPPLHAQLVVHRLADRSGEGGAQHVLGPGLCVRALRQVEVADAQVLEVGAVALKFGAEHLRPCQLMLEARGEIQRFVRFPDRSVDQAGGHRGDDRLGVVGVDAVGGERQRRALLPERAVHVEAIALEVLVALGRREGVAGVQRVVAETHVRRAAPAVEPGLRGDVDRDHARFVGVGGEHVPAEANLLNLTLRRQLAAAEPVDAKHRARSRQVFEHLLHFVGVVGQLVDLLGAEHRCERIAARIAPALARIAADVDSGRQPGERELDVAPVVAGADAIVADVGRLEARRLHVNGEAPRRQRRERDVAARPGLERDVTRREHHARADDHRPGLIEHRHSQRPFRARLRGRDCRQTRE